MQLHPHRYRAVVTQQPQHFRNAIAPQQFVGTLDKIAQAAPAGSESGIAALKSAIVTSNAAYENISKVAKQFGETAKSNFEAAAQRTAQGVKKAKK